MTRHDCYLLAFALLLFSSIAAYPQNQDFRFTHLTTANGLSQSNITSILQDDKGFMWFGTFNGLNRYDGYRFEIFNYAHHDQHGISHNYISSLFQDRSGYLWVGTGDGLNRYDKKTNGFIAYKHDPNNPNSIADNQIGAILEDSQGRLWVATANGGLNLHQRESESFIHHFHDPNDVTSLSSNRIEKLFEDSGGNLWITHANGAVDILSSDGATDDAFRVRRKKITDFPITAIVESADENIWIGTQGDGLYRLKREGQQIRQIAHYMTQPGNNNSIGSNIVLSLMIEDDNTLWIGTEDNGIDILNIEANTFRHNRHDPLNQSSLNHDSVWQIYKDNAGNIWIGTYGYGINLLSGNKSFISHYSYQPGNENSLSHNMVNSFVEDKNNNIWIATDGGGLNLFDRQRNQFIRYNSKNSNIDTDVVVSLLEDRRGILWIGTWTTGLYQFDPIQKRFMQYTLEEHGIGSNRVLHIFEDNDGGLWLSTFYGGVTYFNPDDRSATVYNTSNSGLSDNYTRVVHQDFKGDLWIGTDSGVDVFDVETKTFIHYKHDASNPASISKGFVHTITQSEDSIVWVGTTSGLSKFNSTSGEFSHYDTDDGLPDNEIKCIIQDQHQDGVLWLSTNKGISRFNTKSGTSRNFDITDGLQGNEFNPRSGWKTELGELIFGGNNGFNIFRPTSLRSNDFVPPVLVTNFKIFNKPVAVGGEDNLLPHHISESSEMNLSYKHAVFSFEFVALNYISPEKNQYAYIMEGFEDSWNYVGSSRTATYTNLDPGDYVFKVKASNNDGVWNEAGTEIKISISPPFWRTWWAYLIAAVLLLAAIVFLVNYYHSQQRLKNALKLEHMELEKMYELDQVKTRFFNNISHEFHSPLTLILSPLEKLLSSRQDGDKLQNSLKLIHRNAQRLQRMTNQLRDFQQIESDDVPLRLLKGDIILFIREIFNSFQEHAGDHNIRYRLNTEVERCVAWFDPDKLDKIIYNLLSNAFKFTADGGEISLSAAVIQSSKSNGAPSRPDQPRQSIEITVKDNGIGIPAEKIPHIFERYYRVENENGQHAEGSGIGLAFVYELVNLYQGEISVESSEGKGSGFTVQIPIDEHFLEAKQLVGEFSVTEPEDSAQWELVSAVESNGNGADLAAPENAEKGMPAILIVEDDVEVREFIRDSLQSKYRVFAAANGREGLESATKSIPDLVISDIKMPELSGIELCNRLKEDEKTSHIPIILLTAYTSREAKIEGLSKGADAYLPKPFGTDELDVQITNLLESRRKLKEKYCRQILLEPSKVEIEDLDEKFLQRVIETIEAHMSDNKFNAELLSREVGMSRMQLYRKIRGLTNLTVHEFIRTIRLKRATQFLKEKRMTITEVAYAVGFNDLTYFARCFRKHYKKSPSEFVSEKS